MLPASQSSAVQPEAGARVGMGRISTTARSTAVGLGIAVGAGVAVGGGVVGGTDAVGAGVADAAGLLLGMPALGAVDGDPAVEQADRRAVARMMAIAGRMRDTSFGHATPDPRFLLHDQGRFTRDRG